MTAYRTVSAEAEAEYTEKRSRFIAAICPVSTEEQALEYIRRRSKTYWDARHNVYAYVLSNGNLCRFSDDGEPQGTAGIPALDVLRKGELTDCVVVITRYFGGILLGGGGLVRAYSHATALAVRKAGIVEMRPCLTGHILCDYAQYGWVSALLLQHGAIVEGPLFDTAVTVPFILREADRQQLESALTDRSAGQLTLTVTGERMVPFPAE